MTHRAVFRPLLVAFLVAACSNESERETAAPAFVEPAHASAAPDSLPREIYYQLTSYPWYARAEPLVFNEHPYMPRGAPESIPLAKLHLAGNYQGVDFYVLRGDEAPPDALYVPVFEGYWLPFAPRQ